MSRSLSATVILYALTLAVLCVGLAAIGRRRPPVIVVGLAVIEIALVAQGILDGLALATGRHASEAATNIGYLLTSISILPLTATAVRLDPGRWGNAALAVGCVLVAVVSLRLHQTLDAGHV